MAKYDISKQALEDLYKIWEYTVDTWSETQADKYYKLLENAMNEIGTSPQETGKPYDEIMTGLKGYHAGKHLIFYITCNWGQTPFARFSFSTILLHSPNVQKGSVPNCALSSTQNRGRNRPYFSSPQRTRSIAHTNTLEPA